MKDNIYTVYIHYNKINNKSYIGLTSAQPPSKRWGSGGSHYSGQFFYRAINKYGWDNFEHIIWATNLTYEEANHLEFLLIQLFHTDQRQYGYNIDKGGNSIGKHSEETRRKISKNHADFSGENHPMYGKHHSEKTKQKMREKALGRKKQRKKKVKLANALAEQIILELKRFNALRLNKFLILLKKQPNGVIEILVVYVKIVMEKPLIVVCIPLQNKNYIGFI